MEEAGVSRSFEGIPLKEIPVNLLRSLFVNLIQFYTIPLSRISSDPKGEKHIPSGVGTLVSHLGRHYILTAYHVWSESLKHGDDIGIIIKSGTASLRIERRYVEPIIVGRWENEAWGPDLALLPLGSPDVSSIGARKSFYNLARKKAELEAFSPRLDRGLWMAVGVPDVLSKKTQEGYCLAIRGYGSILIETHQKGDFDYYDFSINYKNKPDMPSTFGGMSGGGLWQVNICKDPDTGEVRACSEPYLAGVIFYEEFVNPPNIGRIRCHGRNSIYTQALAAL